MLTNSQSHIPAVSIYQASRDDHYRLSVFIENEFYVHHHLDWRPQLEWLGEQPFLIAERAGDLLGLLSMPPDPPGVYWLRLFAGARTIDTALIFKALFQEALNDINQANEIVIPTLAFYDWFAEIIGENHFEHVQDIVVLEWSTRIPHPIAPQSGFLIRRMISSDLEDVLELDNQAFEKIWQLSKKALEEAFHQSSYATVCCLDAKILGYQLSTGTIHSTHLARLAVNPSYQRHHIAADLLLDLLTHTSNTNVDHLTVNTQSTNTASLALYQSLGFEPTGETFPVSIFHPK